MASSLVKEIIKDPSARKDYGFNWAPWLDTDDTIDTSTWTADNGVTLSDSTHDGTTTTIWAEGGTDGANCRLVNHIVTVAGREDDCTVTLFIRQQ